MYQDALVTIFFFLELLKTSNLNSGLTSEMLTYLSDICFGPISIKDSKEYTDI